MNDEFPLHRKENNLLLLKKSRVYDFEFFRLFKNILMDAWSHVSKFCSARVMKCIGFSLINRLTRSENTPD